MISPRVFVNTVGAVFCIFACVVATTSQSSQDGPPANSSVSDGSAFRSVIQRLFEAYSRKDRKAFIALWTVKSPFLENATEEIIEIFAKARSVNADVRQVSIDSKDADNATVDVDMDFRSEPASATDEKFAYETGRWKFHLVREGGDWKIWRRWSAERRLADQ